jgi:hypothetical protein
MDRFLLSLELRNNVTIQETDMSNRLFQYLKRQELENPMGRERTLLDGNLTKPPRSVQLNALTLSMGNIRKIEDFLQGDVGSGLARFG